VKKLPFIVAEAAQGYEGNKRIVELYVRAAANTAADAIKFQIFYADELALPDYKYYPLFKELELPTEVWAQAVRESHRKGLEFYSDVVGTKSFRMLEAIGVDGYKIHTTNINNISFLKVVARSRKKIFLSTGGCQLDEVDKALNIFDKCRVILMHGFQAEPTQLRDNNFNRIRTLSERYNKPVGVQDHTHGDSELALYIPLVALGAGATVVEKHLTLSRRAEIEDYISALTAEEFASWVKMIKAAYETLGDKQWKLRKKERRYRALCRRMVCSSRDIGKGKIITKSDLILKRTVIPNVFFEIEEVLGKKAKKFIRKNSAIRKGDVR